MSWDPELYAETIRDEIADYDELQRRVVESTGGRAVRSILDLGVGAGETAARVMATHPDAHLVGVDSSAEMLEAAATRLDASRVRLVHQGFDQPLPDGPFDLVVSALAIHHLEGTKKRDLFGQVARRLSPTAIFVMGDVVVPDDPSDAVIELEENFDFPSSVEDQLGWLRDSGLTPEVVWASRDLAVLRARRMTP